jgi:hypothetical protein
MRLSARAGDSSARCIPRSVRIPSSRSLANSRSSAATPVTTARGLLCDAVAVDRQSRHCHVGTAGASAGRAAPRLPARRRRPLCRPPPPPSVPADGPPGHARECHLRVTRCPSRRLPISAGPCRRGSCRHRCPTAPATSYAMGRTAGVATAHVGGTDSAPTVLASANPADRPGGVVAPCRLMQGSPGSWFQAAGSLSPARPLFPVPAADDVIGVHTGAITDDVERKRRSPRPRRTVCRRRRWRWPMAASRKMLKSGC